MDASWAVGVASSTTGPRLIVFSAGLKRTESEEMADEWIRKSTEATVGRGEARVTTEGGKGHTLRQREATSKNMTASHTNHQRAYCSANYCTSQSQVNDKNQHWLCLCWGNIRRTPLSFSISSFLFLSLCLSLYFPSPSLFSSLLLTIPPCLYFLNINTVIYMYSTRVRGQLSQQRLCCVAHMEKLTAMGRFSPQSYVNSFDEKCGLSPECGGIAGSEGFHCCTNPHLWHQ